MPNAAPLRWRNLDVLPLIHGRVPFAIQVRERMLARRYAALAVELPPSLAGAVAQALDLLPAIHVVLYRETPGFLAASGEWSAAGEPGESLAWYLAVDPCDGVIEALRIARGERTPVHHVDAEVEQFAGRPLQLPDSHAVLELGPEAFYEAVQPALRQLHPPTAEDLVREGHMAARLRELSARVGPRGEILFLCGMAHWERIHRHLEEGSGALHAATGPPPELIQVLQVQMESLPHLLGETPFTTFAYEQHRAGIDLARHDQVLAVKELLLAARDRYRRSRADSLERATPAALRAVMAYTRKLTLQAGRLTPDLYALVVAAKGVVGNDFALEVLEVAREYPPNRSDPAGAAEVEPPAGTGEDEPGEPEEPPGIPMTSGRARVGGAVTRLISRTPGEHRELRRVRLQDRPPRRDQRRWRTVWNPYTSCSWPPEDVLIENFRSYLASRTLSLAGVDRLQTEEFRASLKDGLAIRETLRDLPRGKIHVKEEPRVPGRVGAVVIIFEEDDDGSRFPWRTTWMAEHGGESTLAFYATNFLDDMIGPGIGRARYGGCLMIYPPLWVPDVWEDLRLERARRPSERLLLGALLHSREHFVAHVSARPPAPEIRQAAAARGKHIVHLPLTSFSAPTLERLRRFHVLNDQRVRGWAARFIR